MRRTHDFNSMKKNWRKPSGRLMPLVMIGSSSEPRVTWSRMHLRMGPQNNACNGSGGGLKPGICLCENSMRLITPAFRNNLWQAIWGVISSFDNYGMATLYRHLWFILQIVST